MTRWLVLISVLLGAPGIVTAADDQAETSPNAGDTPSEVVVTGTRIGRSERDYVADSPIVTVNADSLANASQPTVDSMLQRLPQLTGSGGIGNGQNATSAGSGLATLNLRNLGDNRNLVLLDGRRMTPASNTFAGIRPDDVAAFVVAQLLGAATATALFRWLLPPPKPAPLQRPVRGAAEG